MLCCKARDAAKTAVDRGYRGAREVVSMQILVPGKASVQARASRQAMRQRFLRHDAIEPTSAHLKSDFRLARNYLRGFAGDSLNLLLVPWAWMQTSGRILTPLPVGSRREHPNRADRRNRPADQV